MQMKSKEKRGRAIAVGRKLWDIFLTSMICSFACSDLYVFILSASVTNHLRKGDGKFRLQIAKAA